MFKVQMETTREKGQNKLTIFRIAVWEKHTMLNYQLNL